ncbi:MULTISPECIES: MFS transporter [Streptomyces]|uniref:MFS transporter n=1 Tax=Streptomyces TaxID=1883 RepID=UPI00163C18D2|nr:MULTISPECIES: MFS transporter [Streptomyces]MBC2877826.1 MFS transporter [Streptomyces sp. TYQ1024]UKW30552.1 MFS transporter [Streptomyces sp. TYQ1024]
MTAGLSVLSHGLVEAGERAWGTPRVWAPVVAGLLLLVAFVVVELRVQKPLLPLGFLVSRRRAAALGAILVGSAGMSAIFFFLSLYLQEVRSASPLLTSAAFLPFGAAQLAAGPLAARAVRNRGARSVTAGGLVLCAGGLLLLGRLGADTPYLGGTLAGLLLFPVGIACVFSGATVAALEGVRDDRAGLAGGVVNTVMEVGPTVGLAALVTLAATRADRLRHGGTAAAEAVSAGYGYGLTVAAAVCAGGAALVAYALKRVGPDGERDGGGGGGAGPVP